MKRIGVVLTAAILVTFLLTEGVQAALITSAGDPSLAGSTLINFNSESYGFFNSRTISGVTFSRTSTGQLNIEDTYSGAYGSTGRYLATQGLNTAGGFDITFSVPVSAFGMSWGAADRPWALSIFDTSNALIATYQINAQTSPYIGFVGANSTAIARAHLQTSDGTGDYVLIDDFRFVTAQQTAVPEPGTMTIFGAGICCVVLYVARRRKDTITR